MRVRIASWNFENNGGGDPEKRLLGTATLKSLNPHLVLRQEMWDADANGHEIFYEQARVLDMRGVLGPRSCTALFLDPRTFIPVRDWPEPGTVWELPPTALTLRYRHAAPGALPLQAVSYHLNYASPTKRLAEAEWLTTWADKKLTLPNGQTVRAPALLGGDNNSYPHNDVTGGPKLPRLSSIKDRPHRLHRSYPGPDGHRLMDTRPDAALHTAGLVDVARHWATTPGGNPAAVARTVDASATHGPDSRIDRIYTTPDLLHAITSVEVIEVPDLSDHHIVVLDLDADVLADALGHYRIAS